MNKQSVRKIGVLCGGGDCPGLNAVIRAVVKTAILRFSWEVRGSINSFNGLLSQEPLLEMTLDTVRGILPRGGTILGTTNRGDPFHYAEKQADGTVAFHDYSRTIVSRCHQEGLDALIVIGGDGTLAIAQKFFDLGLPVIGVPKTIDNDILATEISFGFDTALKTATEAIDKIHTTAESHGRVMVVEVMGRNAGWIALEAGVAGGADVILIPEIPFFIEKVCDKLHRRIEMGREFSIVVVAEGAAPAGGSPVYVQDRNTMHPRRLGGVCFGVAAGIEQGGDFETRVLILGHLQRGGSPSPFDRILGTRFGVAAVELAASGGFGQMCCLRCGQVESAPIRDAIAHERLVNPLGGRVDAARAIGISFGD